LKFSKILSVVLGLALASGLAACGSDDPSTDPSTSASASESASPGESATPDESASPSVSATPEVPATVIDNLDGITVTGDFGAAVTVEAAGEPTWPLKVDTTINKVLIEGTGQVLSKDEAAGISYTGVNARTGEVFDASSDRGTLAYNYLSGYIAGFTSSLDGKKVGDRVLMAITGADGYDSNGGQPTANILVGDTLIFVVDIVTGQYTGPQGTEVPPVEGVPTVTDDADGVPQVSIPEGATAPTQLVVQPLIEGAGPAVADGDGIMTHYLGVNWDTGEVITSVYDQVDNGLLSEAITGWKQGLVGQTAGSRVVLVTPPSFAYPDGNTSMNLPAGQTIVWVVDILFSYPAS
jgi:peptidylprolyl isomerase